MALSASLNFFLSSVNKPSMAATKPSATASKLSAKLPAVLLIICLAGIISVFMVDSKILAFDFSFLL